jgi:hypothetical protein
MVEKLANVCLDHLVDTRGSCLSCSSFAGGNLRLVIARRFRVFAHQMRVCVLGVVRLEVCLIAGLLPWSSGKSKRHKCSTLRKLINHGRSQEY